MSGEKIRYEMISARDKYINIIKSELLGPGSEFKIPNVDHELISSSPLSRYSIGILFPQGNLNEQDNDETISVNEEEAKVEEIPETSVKLEDSFQNKSNRNYEYDDMDEENLDEEISLATQYKPSSMGMTFLVQGTVDKIYCNISFATYRKANIKDCIVPYEPENPDKYCVPREVAHIMNYDKKLHAFKLVTGTNQKEIRRAFENDTIPENEFQLLKNSAYRLNDYLNVGYVREPHNIENYEIDFSGLNYFDGSEIPIKETKVKIVALKTPVSSEIWSVTIMFENALEAFPAKATECVFQSKIEVNTKNNSFVFTENNLNSDIAYLDDEEKSLDLLYRNKKIYGIGLGTSVDWNINENGNGAVWTDFFPVREIPSMSFSLPENDIISDEELSMKYLSDLSDISKEEKLITLKKLVDLYVKWIDSLKETAKKLDGRYISAASKNIRKCEMTSERMYSGIKTLQSSENAYAAFELANRAMFMQRIHIQKQAEMSHTDADRYPGDEEISNWLTNLNYKNEDDNDCRWRPFQLAFLLMDIDSIVYNDSSDRSIVDLIWFPTGGGKTEAYLGLTAFTIFFRKLAYPNTSGGTAVMMRYTLRLLAAQQFTRAATLICACEYIRQDSLLKKSKYPKYSLGKEAITIGLWIGGSHIPNNNTGDNSAEYHLKKLFNVSSYTYVKTEKDRHNKFQVLKCPWCGTKMVKDNKNGELVGEWGYAMHNKKHFCMFCPNEDCDFTNKLPIQIIDEELYNNPPTLLFGTVDKFAMIAWDGRTGAFFGVNSNHRSPDLIIQDELHLISGALGTIVGLYETAVDGLSCMKGFKPKIIASTATIRRAKEQCSALYNREVVQFPAPGLDANDSFFAREEAIDYSIGKYGRKYVGIMPSGRTKAMTEIRAIAALLQKAFTMNLSDEVKDKIWTLTVYFNSLKDLGKASTLVEDDVKDFIIRIANRMFTSRRLVVNADELTSRVSTTELNETLDKLERIEYSKENIENKKYASNILLATNMISVGIDVARLNVMLMVGQPKLTSEYIQASSRVGRSYPGIVFVQYDATKSRDRSHYEQFRAYHDSFYKFVEPTGVTPFSKPARERALHAVFTAMLRQKVSLIKDSDANLFDENNMNSEIEDVSEFIIKRISQINERSVNKLKDDIEDVKKELQEFIDFWQRSVDKSHKEGSTPLYFGRKYMVTPPSEKERRLFKQYNSPGNDDARETLTSMRNVDAQVTGEVIIWEDSE